MHVREQRRDRNPARHALIVVVVQPEQTDPRSILFFVVGAPSFFLIALLCP
jgi:hypothetical protein